MILYYSLSGNTKMYADILSVLTNEPIYPIIEKTPRSGTLGKARGIVESILNLSVPIEPINVDQTGRAIYICAPIWAGNIAPAVRTYIKNTNLQGKKINLILTCSEIINQESYRKKAEEIIILARCTPGFVHSFVCDKRFQPEPDVVRKHLKKLVLNVDETF